MGCGNIYKRNGKITKLVCGSISSSVHKTRSSLNMGLEKGSSYNQCLNIKIEQETHKICSSCLNLSGSHVYMASCEYMRDFNYVRDSYSSYLSAKSYFCQQVHEACFNDFQIQYGLFIVLISIYRNEGVKVEIISEAPFVIITGSVNCDTDYLFKSWAGFMKVLEIIARDNFEKMRKSVKRLQVLLSILNSQIETSNKVGRINKAIRLCEDAINVANKMITDIEKKFKDIQEFFKKFSVNLKEIKRFVELAKGVEIFSGERIVHLLLSN